jgi:hypothetical protein
MKKRYLYTLLFGIPGFFIAGIISLFMFGASLGVLWLFVFGDNPWPVPTDKVLSILLVLTFLILWIALIVLGYMIGKRLEADSALNRKHVLLSAGLTAMFILFIILQQWSVENIGPKSDSMLCGDYCAAQGYSGSGMPPQISGDRTCTCYDNSGNEVIQIPLDTITPEAPK